MFRFAEAERSGTASSHGRPPLGFLASSTWPGIHLHLKPHAVISPLPLDPVREQRAAGRGAALDLCGAPAGALEAEGADGSLPAFTGDSLAINRSEPLGDALVVRGADRRF